MRNPVALLAAIFAIVVLASSGHPIFAASSGDMPRHVLALQDPPPSSNGLIGLVASASAGARRSESAVASAGLTIQAATNSNPALENSTIKGLARAVAGVSAEERSVASAASFPSLDQFIASVENDQSNDVTGVYVKDVMALKVLQHPAGNPLSVTALPGWVTQSCGIKQCPSVGFLAHNFLAGALFSRLSPNQEVALVHGDGSTQRFRVSKVKRFQALNPTDPYSDFVDLENGNQKLSSTDVFNQTFGVGRQVVFQTCISANGNLSWGRLFVIADPV